jgi:hypothetical protein
VGKLILVARGASDTAIPKKKHRDARHGVFILDNACSTLAFSLQTSALKETLRNSFCGMKRKARGAQSPRVLGRP